MLKIRRSRDRLIFNMGIPIPGKGDLYIETGPRAVPVVVFPIALAEGAHHKKPCTPPTPDLHLEPCILLNPL